MQSATQSRLTTALAPIDRARGALVRLAATSWLRPFVVSRDRRLALQAVLGVGIALAATTLAPLPLFALSPFLLGVPHVAADVRYLVLRPSLPRAWLLVVAGACAALVLTRAAKLWVDPRVPAPLIEGAVAILWMAGGAVLGARAAPRRMGWLLVGVGGLAVVLVLRPRAAQVAFLYLHNVVAVALWLLLFRARRRFAIPPLLALVGAAAILLSGVTLPVAATAGSDHFAAFSLADAAALVAPGAPPALGARLVLLYVFFQSIHYAVWLGWIPQDNLVGEGTRTFRQTVRGLVADFRTVGLVLIVIAMLVLFGGAAIDLYQTRQAYLSVANFHGVLEVATLVFALGAGKAWAGR